MYFSDRPARCRFAFALGNVAPDVAATTYLRGHLHDRRTWGHSYANALPIMRRRLNALTRCARGTMADCFHLGVLLHYTADAFTRPHNEQFAGNLKQHVCYERLLHRELQVRLAAYRPVVPPDTPDAQHAHARYVALAGNVATDADYILTQTALLSERFARLWTRRGLRPMESELSQVYAESARLAP